MRNGAFDWMLSSRLEADTVNQAALAAALSRAITRHHLPKGTREEWLTSRQFNVPEPSSAHLAAWHVETPLAGEPQLAHPPMNPFSLVIIRRAQ